MKKLSLLLFYTIILVVQVSGQNVGIGINNPDTKLQVDSAIRIGKNQVLQPGQKNSLKFGDGDYATISEQGKDDRLILNAKSFSFSTGKVAIGLDSARESLDVNGALILGNATNSNLGTVRYNNTRNDIEFRDISGWNAVKNRYFTKDSYNIFDTSRNREVDMSGTDLTVPETGVYLINYYVDAYNSFYLAGEAGSSPDDNKIVYSTYAFLFNKTANYKYQQNKIDFLDIQNDYSGAAMFYQYRLPAHQVSGSTVQPLTANDKIGIKMKQTTDPMGFGEMRLSFCTITLVRLY
jgi:hypothetical protein